MSFKPTAEQQAAINKGTDELVSKLKINAGAGAAKTTTLGLIAEEAPVNSLYLAFNKSMVEEAKNRFPGWVEVRTTHGLAYATFGAQIRAKLS